jgi:predicted site-specific integrase-resolvase
MKKFESKANLPSEQVKVEIFNTDELMTLLKVSRRTVQNWRDEGTIEFSQINGKIYYRMSAIAKMLDQNLIKK